MLLFGYVLRLCLCKALWFLIVCFVLIGCVASCVVICLVGVFVRLLGFYVCVCLLLSLCVLCCWVGVGVLLFRDSLGVAGFWVYGVLFGFLDVFSGLGS